MSTLETIGAGLIVGVVVTLVLLGGVFITAWAWNIFMPAVFGLPEIGFMQAVALDVLTFLIKPTVTVNTKQ